LPRDNIKQAFGVTPQKNTTGVYQLYGKTDGMLEIDAQGSNWDSIPYDLKSILAKEREQLAAENPDDDFIPYEWEDDLFNGEATTRQIAMYAHDRGYTGVIIKNVFDNGGKTNNRNVPAASVYIYFNPQQQVKSADTVTYDDNGNVIPLDQRFTGSNDIRYSYNGEMTTADMEQALAEADAGYMSAVNRGDTKEAQRMVDEAANNAGYIYGKVYHGTPNNEFTEFKDGIIFFTSNKDAASEYQDPGEMWATNYKGGRTLGSYIKLENPLILDNSYSDYRNEHTPWQEWEPTVYGRVPDNAMNATDVAKRAKELGYDGVIIKNDKDTKWADSGKYLKNRGRGDTIIAFSAEQIKSADPVTYDDNGNVIPLSERFNTQNRDFRYSYGNDMTEADMDQALVNAGVLSQEDIDAYDQKTSRPLEGKSTKWTQTEGPAQRQFGGENGMLQDTDELDQFVIDYVSKRNAYFPDTNASQVNRALNWVRNLGQKANQMNQQNGEAKHDAYSLAVQKVTSKSFDYRSADGQARMVTVMALAAAKNDVVTQVQLAEAYNRQGTDLGRTLQSRKLFRLMTPEGRIATLQKMLTDQQDTLDAKGRNIDLKFSEWVYRAAAVAETESDFRKVENAAVMELAEQVPANWRDRVRSWRMISMLANPRTHIRNVIGNAMFIPAVSLKNKLGAVAELGVEKGNRTKTLAPFLNPEIRQFAREDAVAMKDVLTGEAKYNEATEIVKAQKKLGGIVDTIGKGNSWALEKEDWIFLKGHYRRALGGWMQANGYTVDQVKNDAALLEKGRAYAINEAQKATYRDFNKTAQSLNEISRKGGVMGFIVDAALPFKKTPANILRRGIEYSPAGLVKSLTYDMVHLKQYLDYQKGKLKALPEKAMSPTQVIDDICSGLSGSVVATLGFLLAGCGAVSCGLDDDEDKLEKLKGNQEYAINLGKAGNAIASVFGIPKLFGEDVTFTLDWAAPMSMPFFVGAAIRNQMENEGGFDFNEAVNSLGNIAEPVFNLSMLDGVNSLFKTSQYDDTNEITQILAKIVTNYGTSYVPSALGAVTRTFFDDKRRRAFVTSGENTGIEGTARYAWEQVENKLPGVSTSNIPYRDAWGNADEGSFGLAERILENFILPGYVTQYKEDTVVNELGRLYEATGDKALIPTDADKSIKYDNTTYKLGPEEYDQYVVARGQAAYNGLTELVNSEAYQKAMPEEQASMVKAVWDYANQVGKKAVIPDFKMSNKADPVKEAIRDGSETYYKDEMMKALQSGDVNAYDTCIEALHEIGVEDSTIKTKISNTYCKLYKDAYRKNDFEAMLEIENILDETGYDFDVSSWEEQVDKEQDKEE
jgi:hypothetical protein